MPFPRHRSFPLACLAIVCAAATGAPAPRNAAHAADAPGNSPSWNPQTAAHYLDTRELEWQSWDHAKREQGTFCVSCHTQLSYAYARPALRSALNEPGLNPPEEALLASVRKRVQGWSQFPPFYSDAQVGASKVGQARSTEATLNALILLRYDDRHLSPTTRTALQNMWNLQLTSGPDLGSWKWLNSNLAPWETPDAQYFGAAMVAQAVSAAPDNYAKSSAVVGNLAALRVYLTSHATQQPLFNRIVVLWASSHMPALFTPQQRKQLIREIYNHQNPDGGWSLASLGPWQRLDKTPEPTASDGYATGLAVLALEESKVQGAYLEQGIHWLETHQDPATGTWPAQSLNKNRDPGTNVGKFMTDASTAFAALALEDKP